MIGEELGERIATLVMQQRNGDPGFRNPASCSAISLSCLRMVGIQGAGQADRRSRAGRIDAVAVLSRVASSSAPRPPAASRLTARKAGKLPGHVIVTAGSKYGTAHGNAPSRSGTCVLIAGDVLATGTANAAVRVAASVLVPPSGRKPFSSGLMRWVDARC